MSRRRKERQPQKKRLEILLVGDSDIAYWPLKCYPSALSGNGLDSRECGGRVDVDVNVQSFGVPGATLPGVVHNYLPGILKKFEKGKNVFDLTVFVVCAGENDIGNGVPLVTTIAALKDLLVKILGVEAGESPPPPSSTGHQGGQDNCNRKVIFLGPKFEPWMDGGALDSKKKYAAMSRAMERCCREFGTNNSKNCGGDKNRREDCNHKNVDNNNNKSVYYVDCLTMFCGESRNQPGAVLGGRAKAERRFFRDDALHLNDSGYEVWRDVVDRILCEN